MDRLTKWDPSHGWQENHDNDTRKWKNGSRACMEKLAAYEDTGLTPEEVSEVAQAKREGRVLPVSPFGTYRGEKVKLVAAASNGNIVIEAWVKDGNGAYSRHILARAEAEAALGEGGAE